MGKLLNLYALWDAVGQAIVFSGIRRATQAINRRNSNEPVE
jgi:hypothetical protein